MCLRHTPHHRSEKSATLHLSNEYKWMMIVGHWEWRCNLTVGWPSLIWNRAAHANTHLTLTVTHTHTHVSCSRVGWLFCITLLPLCHHLWWDICPGRSSFLKPISHPDVLSNWWEGGVGCCCHRNWRLARLSHHSFVMGLVPVQFERNLFKLIKDFWAVLCYR